MPEELSKVIQDFARPKPLKRQTFTKKLKLVDHWEYTFGGDEDDDFMDNFENSVFTKYILEDLRKKGDTVYGTIYEDEKGKLIFTTDVDNYMYGEIEEAKPFEREDLDEVPEEMTFDRPNKFNRSIDLMKLKRYKEKKEKEKKEKEEAEKAKRKEKSQEKAERESMGVEDKLSKEAAKAAEKERKRLKKIENERKRQLKAKKAQKKERESMGMEDKGGSKFDWFN